MLIGTILSFLLAILGSKWNPEATFFLPFTRAWELGIGASLAIVPPVICSQKWREAGGLAGLALILASVVLWNDQTPLYIASGTACAGTALLIALNREKTWASRFLSLPLFVGIGLISYSLYLWHWPLLSFAHYYFGETPPATIRLLMISAAVGLAYLSWVVVEQPLRRGKSARNAFLASIFAMVVFGGTGVFFWSNNGFVMPVSPEVAQIEEEAAHFPRACFGCGSGSTVLWGDSHATAMSSAIPGIRFSRSACPPLIGANPSKKCGPFNRDALQAIAKLDHVKTIVLVGRWALSTETVRFGEEEGGRYFLRDDLTREDSVAESRRAFVAALPRTVRALEKAQPGAKIVIIGQAPEPGFNVVQCLVQARLRARSESLCQFSLPGSSERVEFSNKLIESIATKDSKVTKIILSRQLCSNDKCRAASHWVPLFRDVQHLSRSGARALVSSHFQKSPGSSSEDVNL